MVASGGQDQTLRLWNVETSECRVLSSDSGISAVAFSPGEKTVAGGDNHGSLHLWNIQTGEQLTTLRSELPYEKMNISGMKGISETQQEALLALGAIEQDQA
jgi:WD40 repeat protein